MKTLLASVVAVALAATAASAASPPQLPVADLQTPTGHASTLRAGVTYEATSEFPIALRVTPPDGSWSGAQWTTGRLPTDQAERLGKHDHGGPPFYGWVALQQGSPKLAPKGIVVITTAYARTPSVAATVSGLRTRGHGATYQAMSSVRVGGFSGIQFDGRVVTKHVFVPFSPPSNAGGAYPGKLDAYQVSHDQSGGAFRVIVLNVRGKTVVVFLDSAALPADRFPAFLTKASRLLGSLRFPNGG
jgi:hypothetical protein